MDCAADGAGDPARGNAFITNFHTLFLPHARICDFRPSRFRGEGKVLLLAHTRAPSRHRCFRPMEPDRDLPHLSVVPYSLHHYLQLSDLSEQSNESGRVCCRKYSACSDPTVCLDAAAPELCAVRRGHRLIPDPGGYRGKGGRACWLSPIAIAALDILLSKSPIPNCRDLAKFLTV